MDTTAFCSRVLSGMGRPVPGRVLLRFYFILFIFFLNLFQLIIGTRSRWSVLKLRFQSIEDLFVIPFMTTLACDMALSPEKFTSMFEIISQQLHGGTYSSERQQSIMKITKDEEVTAAKSFLMITAGFAFVNGVIPYIYGIYYIANTDHTKEIVLESIPMPIECWLPLNIDNTFLYIILVSPQVLCFINCGLIGYCWFSTVICSLLHIQKELELLCISINEIDAKAEIQKNTFTLDMVQQKRLHKILGDIILNHQEINRVTTGLNKVLALIILLLNYVCCAQMCVILYSFFESKEMSSRIKYLLLLIPVFSCFFYFCWYGQQLSNKQENINKIVAFPSPYLFSRIKMACHSIVERPLRLYYLEKPPRILISNLNSDMLQRAVAECSWLNKPTWFKRSLHIMLLRTGQPLQIKPFRLYVLNLNNLMAVCQAAYSYFSLMHKMQVKQQQSG